MTATVLPRTPTRRPVAVWLVAAQAVLQGLVLVVEAGVVLAVSLGVLPALTDAAARSGRPVPVLSAEVAGLGLLALLVVLVAAALGGLMIVLGAKVFRGSVLARLAVTVLFAFWVVPEGYALLADIADPEVPLVSTTKIVELVLLLLLVVPTVGLWTPRGRAWFRERAARRRLEREDAAAHDPAQHAGGPG